jgi:hypothetical protein
MTVLFALALFHLRGRAFVGLLAGYSAFALVRDALALRGAFELRRLSTEPRACPGCRGIGCLRPFRIRDGSAVASWQYHHHSLLNMPTKTTSSAKEHIEYHKDGSVWARGQMANGVHVGYWEWFRLDGTRMRSGHFENGEPAGEWTTYDKQGKVYKVTKRKPVTRKGA